MKCCCATVSYSAKGDEGFSIRSDRSANSTGHWISDHRPGVGAVVDLKAIDPPMVTAQLSTRDQRLDFVLRPHGIQDPPILEILH